MAIASVAMHTHRDPCRDPHGDPHHDRLCAAAFGDAPGTDAFGPAGSADPRTRWLAAVVLGGQGHYAAAATALRALVAHPDPPWASLAASTLASHRRQLGAHAAARRLDALALRRAPPVRGTAARGTAAGGTTAEGTAGRTAADPDGVDAAGARADALAGLAADALGLGELRAAHRLVAAAQRATSESWRTAVRLGWVRAELALASGDARAALAPARVALRLAEQANAVRHIAKSRLVLAAALSAAGERVSACELLHELTGQCARHGLVPLRWPAELLLAELHDHGDCDLGHREYHRRAACAALRFVLRRADGSLRTAAESSLWVPSEGLRTTDSAERSSVGEILLEICTGLCQGSTPRDR